MCFCNLGEQIEKTIAGWARYKMNSPNDYDVCHTTLA